MKKIIISALAIMAAAQLQGQTLEKMQWFNEPESWEIKKDGKLIMDVTPQTDYWRTACLAQISKLLPTTGGYPITALR